MSIASETQPNQYTVWWISREVEIDRKKVKEERKGARVPIVLLEHSVFVPGQVVTWSIGI